MGDSRPLVAHVVYSFGTGGMENGMVNLFNHLPPDRFRHVVISQTGYGEFRKRITAQQVDFYDLGKRPGHDYSWMPRLYRLFSELRPDILHTRNLNALEAQFVGAFWRVKGRVHGEHGRDMYDLDGTNWKYNVMRRAARRVVHHYIAVSQDLAHWLEETVHVPPRQLSQIYNGVDSDKFSPAGGFPGDLFPAGFLEGATCVIGSVGRMAAVKDYPTLVRAFIRLCQDTPLGPGLRLVIVGDGPTRAECQALADAAGLARQVLFPGDRSDTPQWLRAFQVFVLPSLGEGISNTILEAQSTGLPVIASRVGGTPELVIEGQNGSLFAPGDEAGLIQLLKTYVENAERCRNEGRIARERIEHRFSWPRTAAAYQAVYESLIP
ncbi:MAG: TIGR03088 family PEP-CTERM/XrtA system glycosyltransferase [Pseudomonadota bacterium]